MKSPIKSHLLVPEFKLEDLSMVRLEQVLDECFGILPRRYRRDEDPPYPVTIGDLHQQTGIGLGKIYARLSELAMLSTNLNAKEDQAFALTVADEADSPTTIALADFTSNLSEILANIDVREAILIKLKDSNRCFSLTMYLRQNGWQQTYMQDS
jgi:hypothetical protein